MNKAHTKRKRRWNLLGVIVSVILAYAALHLIGAFIVGAYFNYPLDRYRLQRIAAQYDPIIAGLEQYYSQQGAYPDNLEELVNTQENLKELISNERMPGNYSLESGEFAFYRGLNWDGGLVYRSEDGHWRYDPGNGDPDWPINPTTTN